MGVHTDKASTRSPGKKRHSSSSSSSSSSSGSDSSGSESSSSNSSSSSSSSSSSASETERRETRRRYSQEDVVRRRNEAVDNRGHRSSTGRRDNGDEKMKTIISPHSPDEAPPDITSRSQRKHPVTSQQSTPPVQHDKGSTQSSQRSPEEEVEVMETLSLGKRSDDELSIGADDRDMYQDEEMPRAPQQKKKTSRPEAYQDSDEEEQGQSDSDDSYSWRTERVKSVMQSRIHKPKEARQRHRSASYEREDFEAGGLRSIVGTTIKRTSVHDSAESGEITDSDEESESSRSDGQDEKDQGSKEKDRGSKEKDRGSKEKEEPSDRHRSRRTEDAKRTRDKDPERRGQGGRGRQNRDEEEEYREAERNFRKRRFHRTQEESRNRHDRDRDRDHQPREHMREPRRTERPERREREEQEREQPPEKKKRKETVETPLQSKTGGAYIPPAKLKLMQAQIADKSGLAYQRLAWEALKKSINGLINKTNTSNIGNIVQELLQLNIVRGRGLLTRAIIQAQTASPTFTNVYAALVAIINCKFPQNGELVLRRLIINFKKGFRRNDKTLCLSSTRFIAHLVNQQVAHEVIALEVLTLLLENPTDDSVEVVVGFLKECGLKLSEVTPRGIHAIFERLRNILHEGQIEQRVQYMVEVIFANRKDGFKDFPAIKEGLDLVEESEQYTHLLTLEENYEPEDLLNIFKEDPDYLSNEEKYKGIRKEILGEESDESGSDGDGDDGSESDDEESDDEAQEAAKMEIIDQTETNMIALRRTIYLTIQSSLDFEECAHKMLKMDFKPGQEKEVCLMILDCCAQQRTYEKFFGLLAQRFCQLKREYVKQYETIFPEQYETCHRLDTNKLRNVAKFFSHLLHTDAISWTVLAAVRMNEEDTTSSSRIFIKILFQELSEYMGLPKMNARLRDPTLQPYFEGLMPRDNPANTRFSINFFTTIGLGGLTDDLREHLKNYQRVIMQQQRPVESDTSSSGGSSSSSSSSSESSDSSSDSSDSSSSSDSSDSSSSESEDEPKRRRKTATQKKRRDKKASSKREKPSRGRPSPQPENPVRHDKRRNERIDHQRNNDLRGDRNVDHREQQTKPQRSDRPKDRKQRSQKSLPNRRGRDDSDSESDSDSDSEEEPPVRRNNHPRHNEERDTARNGRQDFDKPQNRRYDTSPPQSDRKSDRIDRDEIRREKGRPQRPDNLYETEDKENRRADQRGRDGRQSKKRPDDREDNAIERRISRKERDYPQRNSRDSSSVEREESRHRRRQYSGSPDQRVRQERPRERR